MPKKPSAFIIIKKSLFCQAHSQNRHILFCQALLSKKHTTNTDNAHNLQYRYMSIYGSKSDKILYPTLAALMRLHNSSTKDTGIYLRFCRFGSLENLARYCRLHSD